jgi:DNA-binding winged helix-turn-helix (wHTH) protein
VGEFAAEEPTDQVISFGPFRIETASGRLLRGDTNVRLRLKTFAVLEYLASRPGRLVPKDEILDAVWRGTHITPSVLTGCIRELRAALGDDVKAARFIETVHRRGYRFIAAVVSSAALEAAVAASLGEGGDVELAELALRFAEAVANVMRQRDRER